MQLIAYKEDPSHDLVFFLGESRTTKNVFLTTHFLEGQNKEKGINARIL
jgi:hypothetical protein